MLPSATGAAPDEEAEEEDEEVGGDFVHPLVTIPRTAKKAKRQNVEKPRPLWRPKSCKEVKYGVGVIGL